ncbi:MAG: hypothetical protein E4G92_00430 [Bacteroidia bacterium]|jgi:hypothetical protein|nr:MAG: hypothetical protein E4G92_00430 [Bacteroidia bacterium]
MSKLNLLIVFLLLVVFSCEKGYITDCRECTTGEIGDVKLKIWIGPRSYDPALRRVTIYEGAMEDSLILSRFSTSESYVEYNALLYKDYTVTVEFISNGKNIISVDAACPQMRYDENTCNEPCYYIYGNIIDVRLRYNY